MHEGARRQALVSLLVVVRPRWGVTWEQFVAATSLLSLLGVGRKSEVRWWPCFLSCLADGNND